MITPEDAGAFAGKIEDATDRVVRDYATGDVTHEEPFSDQLCGRLKETLHDFETPNFRWQVVTTDGSIGRARLRARTLKTTDEEPLFGADIVMTIYIQAPDYEVRKGFLVQAKRLERRANLSSDRRRKLLDQCQRMLELTPSSMVFLYHSGGVRVLPAVAVVAAKGENLWAIPSWGYGTLFFDFAICWFGDPRLQAVDPVALEGLRALVDARSALRFSGRSTTEELSHEPE